MELRELSALVDQYVDLRDKRLELDRLAERVKEQESEAKATLMGALLSQGVGGVAGKRYRVTLVKKSVPQVDDWAKLYEHIRITGEFDFLQKRLSPPAVAERWEEGATVPGVVAVDIDQLSVNKL